MANSIAQRPFSLAKVDFKLKISRKTVTKFTVGLSDQVCLEIKKDLPQRFGIMIDGWKGNDKTYYIAIFAIYVDRGENKKMPLLAICPPLDEADHTSESHCDLITNTLKWYNRSPQDLIYLVTDNCSTMRSLAKDYLKCPLVGCLPRDSI